MDSYPLTTDSLLHWAGNNANVIISSHGGILYGKKKLPNSVPFNLHFMVHPNRTTRGKVNSIASMGKSEFTTEPKGTSAVPDQVLSHYPLDTQGQIRECVDQQGFDVLTVKGGCKPTFGKVLKALYRLNRYDDVYCLFCRVAVGKEYKPTVSKGMLSELKAKFKK